MKLPLVRRSSHEKVLEHIEKTHAAEIATKVATLRAQLDEDTASRASLIADRDRLLRRSERLAADLAMLEHTLNSALEERATLETARVDAIAAQSERSGLLETQLRLERDTALAERNHWEGQSDAYRAECERLGAVALRLEAEKRERTDKGGALTIAIARDALLIGTFPRSGTWMLKYFLHFLDFYCRSTEEPSIEQLYDRITDAFEYDLLFDASQMQSQKVTVSHWMCPGVFRLPKRKTGAYMELLDGMNCLEFHRDQDDAHQAFQPGDYRSRIIYVYRNPFDVYRSYADIYERRTLMKERKPYPFNPMAPFGAELMNTTSSEPFEYFISQFAESGFAEFFIAHCMSYLLVRDAYPERVIILRYEDAMADRESYLNRILDFGDVGLRDDSRFDEATRKAIAATDISAMKGYEEALGHALSGAETFYGEANPTHLSVKKRDWRTIFGPEHVDHLRQRILDIEPRILGFLPDLFENQSAPDKKAASFSTES